ncbi:RidA family protein [Oceanicella actignis]|uniref:RidA family protein n=1 Tax=Oceanicella actignis TaxID=1189325 RepID=UPI0011E665A4|nr:RidA family protein [Oceanicella actignis]TYO85362.1 enamine deaminase RidA (YjgF/YER057c/UK114 family) [Oceanicella actignis]
MSDIVRMRTDARMSQIVIHGDTIHLAGQVGSPGADVAEQTRECLSKIEALLAEAGSDKTRILQCTIWLADMADFAQMNAVWDAWTPAGHAPARACGEAKLATPGHRVEFILVAARG